MIHFMINCWKTVACYILLLTKMRERDLVCDSPLAFFAKLGMLVGRFGVPEVVP